MSNPPWDGRLDGAEEAWDALGSFLRREAPGATAHALTGNMAVTRNLRMRASSKRKLVSGGVDLRFLKYEVRGGAPKTAAAPAEAEADAPAEPEAKPAARKPARAPTVVVAAAAAPSPWGAAPSPWGPAPDAALDAVPIAGAADYATRTVVELKDLLRARKLKVSGRKAELVSRLEAHDVVVR